MIILIAGAAIACVTVAVLSARARRPDLRLPHEEDLAGEDEDRWIESLRPARGEFIDRDAPILEIEPEPAHRTARDGRKT